MLCPQRKKCRQGTEYGQLKNSRSTTVEVRSEEMEDMDIGVCRVCRHIYDVKFQYLSLATFRCALLGSRS